MCSIRRCCGAYERKNMRVQGAQAYCESNLTPPSPAPEYTVRCVYAEWMVSTFVLHRSTGNNIIWAAWLILLGSIIQSSIDYAAIRTRIYTHSNRAYKSIHLDYLFNWTKLKKKKKPSRSLSPTLAPPPSSLSSLSSSSPPSSASSLTGAIAGDLQTVAFH